MRSVTFTASNHLELQALFLLRDLYLSKEILLKPTQYTEMCIELIKSYEANKHKKQVTDLIEDLKEYANELQSLDIPDKVFKKIKFDYLMVLKKSFVNSILFCFSFIYATPGLLLCFPFIILIKYRAEQERVEVDL